MNEQLVLSKLSDFLICDPVCLILTQKVSIHLVKFRQYTVKWLDMFLGITNIYSAGAVFFGWHYCMYINMIIYAGFVITSFYKENASLYMLLADAVLFNLLTVLSGANHEPLCHLDFSFIYFLKVVPLKCRCADKQPLCVRNKLHIFS